MACAGEECAARERIWRKTPERGILDLPDLSAVRDFKTYVCVFSLDKKFRNLKTDDDPSGPEGVGHKGTPTWVFPPILTTTVGLLNKLSVSSANLRPSSEGSQSPRQTAERSDPSGWARAFAPRASLRARPRARARRARGSRARRARGFGVRARRARDRHARARRFARGSLAPKTPLRPRDVLGGIRRRFSSSDALGSRAPDPVGGGGGERGGGFASPPSARDRRASGRAIGEPRRGDARRLARSGGGARSPQKAPTRQQRPTRFLYPGHGQKAGVHKPPALRTGQTRTGRGASEENINDRTRRTRGGSGERARAAGVRTREMKKANFFQTFASPQSSL